MKNDDSSVDSQLALIERLSVMLDLLAKRYSDQYGMFIGTGQVLYALYIFLEQKEDLDWAGDFWDVDISFDEACVLLDNFDFNILLNPILYEPVVAQKLLMRQKARFKHDGQIWIIHRYDADPFPSNPHAHDITNGIKLDLSSGDYYKKRTFIDRIRKKDLLEIRDLASKVFRGELPALCV